MKAKTVKEVVGDIQEFASAHNLEIHPGRDLHKWAGIVVEEGYHCPCKPKRLGCPCTEALDDIKNQNCCACRLFVNNSYLSEYYLLLAQRRQRNKRRGKALPKTAN